ncbi:MAG: ROK family protein, partial [Kiritimatiellae bacterium]|nr:ROK family protein [Kiritimatiellia bacterium]
MILGIDIGGTKTSVCAGGADGKILLARRMESHPERGPGNWMERLFAMADQMLAEAEIDLRQIRTVGISAPGPLSVRSGVLLSPPTMTGWETVPIVAPIKKHFA